MEKSYNICYNMVEYGRIIFRFYYYEGKGEYEPWAEISI